jgi:hypothetical protein
MNKEAVLAIYPEANCSVSESSGYWIVFKQQNPKSGLLSISEESEDAAWYWAHSKIMLDFLETLEL